MNHKQASVYAAWVSITWSAVDGRKQASPAVIMAALQRAYDLGREPAYTEGYAAARADVIRIVGEMLGDHELLLSDKEETKSW